MSSWIDMNCTGSDTIAGRFLRRFWHPIAVASLKPGHARPIEILSEKYTLYRSDSGAFHLTTFHCAHRRAQLSVGWIEGENIRCRYHGWLYGPDGQCLEQPAEGKNSFCSKVKLPTYPVREYMGLVFAYLGDGDAPAFVTYPQVEVEGEKDVIGYRRNCNYVNNLENNQDSVHLFPVHHFQRTFDPFEINFRETTSGVTSLVALPGEDYIRVAHYFMPNAVLTRLPITDLLPGDDFSAGYADIVLWRVPRDDNSHENFGITNVVLPVEDRERYQQAVQARKSISPPPLAEITARILRGDVTLEEAEAAMAPEHSLFKPFIEDNVIQEGQGLTQPHLEKLARNDLGVALSRRLWQKELKALADGRPLTAWTAPGPLAADDFSDAQWEVFGPIPKSVPAN